MDELYIGCCVTWTGRPGEIGTLEYWQDGDDYCTVSFDDHTMETAEISDVTYIDCPEESDDE